MKYNFILKTHPYRAIVAFLKRTRMYYVRRQVLFVCPSMLFGPVWTHLKGT